MLYACLMFARCLLDRVNKVKAYTVHNSVRIDIIIIVRYLLFRVLICFASTVSFDRLPELLSPDSDWEEVIGSRASVLPATELGSLSNTAHYSIFLLLQSAITQWNKDFHCIALSTWWKVKTKLQNRRKKDKSWRLRRSRKRRADFLCFRYFFVYFHITYFVIFCYRPAV